MRVERHFTLPALGLARTLHVLALLVVAACPYVPSGELRLSEGTLPVRPGTTVSFSLYCDKLSGGWELAVGPDRCGGEWRVQDVTGGSAEFGTITSCGEYTAPDTRPSEPPEIYASECEGDCSDACGASLILDLDEYSPP